MVTPYEGYVEVCEELNRAHARRPREALGAVQLRRRGGGERGQDRPARTPDARRSSSFDHAYHGRTNLTMALTAKNMPYKHGFGPFAPRCTASPMSYPFRDGGLTGRRGRRPGRSTLIDEAGRRGRTSRR